MFLISSDEYSDRGQSVDASQRLSTKNNENELSRVFILLKFMFLRRKVIL